MKFPSKVTPYGKSVISKFPVVLDALQEQSMRPHELYKKLSKKFIDVAEFVEVLDCLYALGKIEFWEKTEIIRYVDKS